MMIVRVPQTNVNDESVLVDDWIASTGDRVRKGEAIGTLETSKALFDLESEGEGFFHPIAEIGETVPVLGMLYALLDDPGDSVEELIAAETEREQKEQSEQGDLRQATKKAEILAAKNKINIEDVPGTGLIQEKDVLDYMNALAPSNAAHDLIYDVYQDHRAERVLLIGGGRGAVQVLDVLRNTNNQRPVGILDDADSLQGKMIMGVKLLGSIAKAAELFKEDVFDSAIISFSSDLEARAQVYAQLSALGISFTNVIDPSVKIHSNVSIGTGNLIMTNARIGSCSIIGHNNFFSAFVNIEHHNEVGSHCTFGPGVLTSGGVVIGDRVRFGTGIFMEPGVTIGNDCIVASGSIVTVNLDANSIMKTRVQTIIRPR